MLPALLLGNTVGFDWLAVYTRYWFVFYITAFTLGFLLKFLRCVLRTPRAAGPSGRIFGATSVALGLLDVPLIPVIATLWVALTLLSTGAGVVPPFSYLALATMCLLVASIRSVVEKRLIRLMRSRQLSGVGMPFLLLANTVAIAIALFVLYWWTIWTSPTGGKGI